MMDSFWTFLREFGSTLGTLARAQGILVLLMASWVFTGVWVYATERKRHGEARRGQAGLGIFWLPGLLVYYLFPVEERTMQALPESFAFERTPKTVDGFLPGKRQEEIATFDGTDYPANASDRPQSEQETDDGAVRLPAAQANSDPLSQASEGMGFSLEVMRGALSGERYVSPPDKHRVYIGSRDNNDIQFKVETIAPWHVYLSYEKNRQWVLRVVDRVEAKYTTKVNGLDIKMKALDPGDEIQLGDIYLRFEPL